MSVEDWLDMMPHTLLYEAPTTARDAAGHPVMSGVTTSYPCYISPSSGEQMVRLTDGSERKASWAIYVGTRDRLNTEGQITLPDGFSPQRPPVFSVQLWSDEDGAHHCVVLV